MMTMGSSEKDMILARPGLTAEQRHSFRIAQNYPATCVQCEHHYMASGKHVCDVNEKIDLDVVTGEDIVNCTWDCYAMRQESNNQCGYYGKLFVPIKK